MRKTSGFSMIELSVILVIFGLIAGSSMLLGKKWMEKEEFNATQLKIQVIEDALDKYRKINGRLPCPADITLTIDDAAYGFETGNGDGTCPTVASVGSSTSYAAVPAETLGIGNAIMRDSWGQLFVYYVDRRATLEGAFWEDDQNYISMRNQAIGDIEIKDKNGTTRTTRGVYALVSHGANGHGGYKPSRNRVDAGTVEAQEENNCNCNDAATAGTVDNILVQGVVDPDFDDIVVYKLRQQIFNQDTYHSRCIDDNTLLFLESNHTDLSTNIKDYSFNDFPITNVSNGVMHRNDDYLFGISSVYFHNTRLRISDANAPVMKLGMGDFTVDFWVKNTSLSSTEYIVTKGSPSVGNGWGIGILNTGQVFFRNNNGYAAITGAGAINTSDWFHIAVERDTSSANITIFINGTSQATGAFANGINLNSTDDLVIGAMSTAGSNSATNIHIENFRISDVVRYGVSFSPPSEHCT